MARAARQARLAAVAVIALTITGCAGSDQGRTGARAGSECDRAWQEAAAVRDDSEAHDLMHRSFHRCSSYQEWLQVSADHPASLLEGHTPQEFVESGCRERDIARSRVCSSRR